MWKLLATAGTLVLALQALPGEAPVSLGGSAIPERLHSGAIASSAISGWLYSVTATSASSAWAAGTTNSSKTLVLRWNGHAWKRVRSPSPRGFDSIFSITAISARNAWAVGATTSSVLILHWNGTTWKEISSSA